MAKNKSFDFIDGYEMPKENADKLNKIFYSREISGTGGSEARRLSGSALYRFFSRIFKSITYTATKTYGACMLAFGLITISLHFVKEYLHVFETGNSYALIIGALLSAISVPLLSREKPPAVLASEFSVTDYIFFDFLCMKKVYYTGVERGIAPWVGALLGVVLATLGFFFPVPSVLICVMLGIFAYIAFISPEFAFFSSLIVIPYLSFIPYSRTLFAALILLATVSFLRKTMLGKRVIHLEQYDVVLIVFVVALLVGGIYRTSLESLANSGEMALLTIGYMLASNIVTNRRLADRTISAIALSSLPISVISLVTFIVASAKGGARELLGVGISSGFESVDAYAAFLLVAIAFSAILSYEHRGAIRALYTVVILLDVIALVLTGELFALLALICGTLAYFILKLREASVPLLIILELVPYLLFFLPSALTEGLFAILPTTPSADETLALWRESLLALPSRVFVGSGIGEPLGLNLPFATTEAHNLFLGIALEGGVILLLLLVLILLVRLRHRVTYFPYIKGTQMGKAEPIIEATLLSLIIYGATDFIFAQRSLYYLFVVVFGLGSAALRIARKEHDDRILYYEETKKQDSSVLTVIIK